MRIQHGLLRLIEKIPLQAIFIVPFVLQVVLIVSMMGYISFLSGRHIVNTLVADLQDEISQRIEERLDQYLSLPHQLNQIEAFSLSSGYWSLSDETAVLPHFWHNLSVFKELNATFLGTAEGVMVGARRLTDNQIEVMLASEATGQSINYYLPDAQGYPDELVTGAPDYDPRTRSWYSEAMRLGRPHWSPIYLDFATGMLVITAGQPVYHPDGTPLGVLGSAFQFEQVNDFLQNLEIGENGQTFIIDRQGMLVSTSTAAPIAEEVDGVLTRRHVVDSENLIERETAVALWETFGDFEQIQTRQNLVIPIDGQDHYVRVSPMQDEFGLDWLVVISVPASDFMMSVQMGNRITLLAMAVALVSAVLIGIVTTQWVTRPLWQLHDAALAFSAGDWEARVQNNRQDELGVLANTFNRMADQLQSSFALMAQNQARYESMFNYIPIMLYEEDFSAVKQYFDDLTAQGVTDLPAYIRAHPEVVPKCAQQVRILAVNQAVLKTMRLPTADNVLTTLDKLLTPNEYNTFQQELLALAAGETHFEAESTLVSVSRNQRQVFYVRMTIVPGHEESWSRVLVSLEDITHRLHMEDALRQSEQRLKRAQHMGKIGDWEFDVATQEIFWSEEVYRLFERPWELGPPDYEQNIAYYVPEDGERLEQQVASVLRTRQPVADTHRIRLASGKLKYQASTIYPVFDDHGRVIKLTGTTQDITERVLLEKQVQSQERLAAVGQLAAGIAHDFNNILSSIILYTDLLQRSLTDLSPKNQKRLTTITQQTKRATKLIQQILDFSRQSPLQRTPTNILRPLQELVELLRRTLPENIGIHLTYDQSTYIADIDAARIQQVLMNLAVNARDAMPDGGELLLTITTYQLSDQDPTPVLNMPPGDWIQITISDTGSGIDEATLPHVFEPFFTTKPPGKGTGLGLAQVYGVVSQHDGYITIESKIGQGTTFTIFLPRLAEQGELYIPRMVQEAAQGSAETILVVEDDTSTREALVMALEALNYHTVVATNGREALSLMQQPEGEPIQMVLSDMLMPEMSGLELVAAMRQQNLMLPVVILSGYLLEDDLEVMNQLQVTGWLNKPPDLQQLAVLLQQGLVQG